MLLKLSVIVSGFILLCGAAAAAPQVPDWKIIETKYPTSDPVVAGFNVLDFGARGDGEKDCTGAFQAALNRMGQAGGGTVFVPEGSYAIRGTLTIPPSVTLRGEWVAPTAEAPAVKGTVLMAYAGKGREEEASFITVDHSAGIKDISIWYPEQSDSSPVPYPFCLIQKGGNNATFENLTLINPYKGVRIGPGGNECHYIHNIYGTPLKVGIEYDTTTDIGRLENVNFSPAFWNRSGLPGSPVPGGPLGTWLMENGTGIHMLRSDWEYAAGINIDGYNRGFLISEGVRGAANAQFFRLMITNCATALEIEKTNPFGMVFTQCIFEGDQYGIRMSEKFDSAVLLSDCALGGERAIHTAGNGSILLERCVITRGDAAIDNGTIAMTSTKLNNQSSRIVFGPQVDGAALSGCEIAGGRESIEDRTPRGTVRISDLPVAPDEFPIYEGDKKRAARPAGGTLTVIKPTGGDDTVTIQQALEKTASAGGGIVFLPAGNYILKGQLSVPSGVELRGIHDVPHHTAGGGSILHVYPGSSTEPSIILDKSSGIRGMTFNYPEQDIENLKAYPFLLQGRGEDIYVINVNCANPYRFLDLATFRCDRHYVDYLSGAPLETGISISGGSTGGEVRNTQFNPHYWMRTPNNRFFSNRPKSDLVWSFQKENLDAIVVGDCTGQFLFQNFVFGSLYGIHFKSQAGNGPVNCISHGHGTDGSKIGVFFESGSGKIFMINSELVAMSSQNKTAIRLGENFLSEATLINTMVWGSPDLLAEVENGSLLLQNLHCTHHGEGINIGRGNVRVINANFTAPKGGHLTLARRDAEAEITGCITTGDLMVNGKPANRNRSTEIKVEGNISRTPHRSPSTSLPGRTSG